jgi:hypothetical protein
MTDDHDDGDAPDHGEKRVRPRTEPRVAGEKRSARTSSRLFRAEERAAIEQLLENAGLEASAIDAPVAVIAKLVDEGVLALHDGCHYVLPIP